MQARQTTYKGTTMRSRLEATFAQHCDKVDLEWRYEPMCFADEEGQYLPDFQLRLGHERAYVEVKPTEELALAALPKMQRIWSSEPKAVLVAVWRANDPWEHHAWRYTWDSPPSTTWEDVLANSGREYARSGNVIDIDDDGTAIRVELIPDKIFDRRWPGSKMGNRWLGPELTAVEDGVWRLVGPEHPTDLWSPNTIEVSSDGIVTDAYHGQTFFESHLCWKLVNVAFQTDPYR